MKMPEAAAVYTPSPDVARLKMAPHMTDVASPQSIRKSRLMRTGSAPNERSERKTGSGTVAATPCRAMKRPMKSSPRADANVSIALPDTRPPMAPPVSLPASMSSQ